MSDDEKQLVDARIEIIVLKQERTLLRAALERLLNDSMHKNHPEASQLARHTLEATWP